MSSELRCAAMCRMVPGSHPSFRWKLRAVAFIVTLLLLVFGALADLGAGTCDVECDDLIITRDTSEWLLLGVPAALILLVVVEATQAYVLFRRRRSAAVRTTRGVP